LTKRHGLAAYTAIAFLAANLIGAQEVTNWTFGDFQAAIATLQISANTNEAENGELQKMSTSLGVLHSRYIQRYGDNSDNTSAIGQNISAPYSRSMRADLSALKSLPSDHIGRLATLKEINADLALKGSFVSRSLGASGAFPSIITVTVETISKTGQPVSGLWVRCNPHRYGVTTSPLFVFNSASTPTSSILPPGMFTCWVEDGHKTVLLSQPLNLGASGASSENVKFAMP
jgi:hypothetical protein